MKKILISLLFLTTPLWSCDQGCEEYRGSCVCEAPVDKTQIDYVQPSDEQPSRHPEPAYLRGGFIVDMPDSQAAHDVMMDEARDRADAEGKHAAGL